MTKAAAPLRLGVIGARGHTGEQLLRILARHPRFDVVVASSRAQAGARVRDHVRGWPGDLRFSAPDPAQLNDLDAVVLALPNGHSAAYLEEARAETVVVDLSADHRFDPAWRYGLVERNRAGLSGARRVANPGCYATGAQLALGPALDVIRGEPCVFGVSGYSGAGTTPSRKNDVDVLRDNLLPYALVGHVHEREISHHLGRPVRFTPHVAAFFRGISLTLSVSLRAPLSAAALRERYAAAYAREPLVEVCDAIPEVRDNVGRPVVRVGGFATEGKRAVWVATLDNLLKGAATQAVQNLNLACGLPEHTALGLEES